MRFKDYWVYAFSALLRIKLRSSLTIAGVTIGIGAMVLLVSLAAQAERAVVTQLQNLPALRTISVFSPRLVQLAKNRRDPGAKKEALKLPTLDDAALDKFRRIPGVTDVFPNVNIAGDCKLGKVEERVTVTNVSPGVTAATVKGSLSDGGFFSSDDAREVIVPSYLAHSLTAGKGSLVGQEVELSYFVFDKKPGQDDFKVERKKETFKVVGVVKEDGSIDSGASAMYFSLPSNAFVLPEKQALRLLKIVPSAGMLDPSSKTKGQQYLIVSVIVDDPTPQAVKTVRDEIKLMDYPTRNLWDLIETLQYLFLGLKVMLGALGSIALAVAGLQIINTMSMSILERTREIGVMKAVGARNRDIRRLFVFESMLIGLLGALAGLAGAWVVGRVMESVMFHLVIQKFMETPEKMTLFYIPTWLLGGALLFGVGISLLAAIIPAHRAARIDPVYALRRE